MDPKMAYKKLPFWLSNDKALSAHAVLIQATGHTRSHSNMTLFYFGLLALKQNIFVIRCALDKINLEALLFSCFTSKIGFYK